MKYFFSVCAALLIGAIARAVGLPVYSSQDLVCSAIINATEEAGSVTLDAAFEPVTRRVSTDVEASHVKR